MTNEYRPKDFGKGEEELIAKYHTQKDDAVDYFKASVKPRLDRSYKLYVSYGGDRAKEIKQWQANVFVPYVNSVVETLMPRILDARPEFTVQGRNEDDQMKSEKLQKLMDYTWEKSSMDKMSEDITRSAIVYGSSYIQIGWRKDVRELKFLNTKDISNKKYKYTKRKEVFYDAPFVEAVDNYSLFYDWHNIPEESKQYWFKRNILCGAEIKRRYPMADKKRLKIALARPGGDLDDYAAIRNEVKLTHESIVKGADHSQNTSGSDTNRYSNTADQDLLMYEVFEWWRPFDDEYAVMVNDMPILKGGSIPIPYDFKASPFVAVQYLKLPNEFEGVGIPILLESPQVMLNMIKNQRLDSTTLNIHKMWIVNPLANIDKKDLVTRPFGIIYSTDPAGVREVEFSDIKTSAYKEEDLLKGDMRYASGVDDFSMGVGGGASSATEVRHLRESTLERVRLFVNHLGEAYATIMRYSIAMYKQFYTNEMIIRIVGDDGTEQFPIIEKDDLTGEFDFKATVVPSIAGKNDIEKKQGMDLFQLLINLPFIDPKKLTSKILYNWNWNLDSVSKSEENLNAGAVGPDGQPMDPNAVGPDGQPMDPNAAGPEGQPVPQELKDQLPKVGGGQLSPDVIKEAMSLLGGQGDSSFNEASMPIDLLNSPGMPPTVPGVGKTANPRGLNMGGKVNTNIPMKAPNGPDAQIANQANNLQG